MTGRRPLSSGRWDAAGRRPAANIPTVAIRVDQIGRPDRRADGRADSHRWDPGSVCWTDRSQADGAPLRHSDIQTGVTPGSAGEEQKAAGELRHFWVRIRLFVF